MSPSKTAIDSDLIVAHAPYVRALARRLVFDAELAQDVEQDVLLAALQNAPRDQRSIKGWLASIVAHVASKAFRARTRRTAHEAAATIGNVPTPAEILAREDVRRTLIEHVLALDEPVRAVMILRFFEDLPPREVARRLAIPVETVRTRIKRGVEALRSRLEREPGKGRGAWCLALVTGLKIGPPSLVSVLGASLPGVIAMGVSKKVAAIAVAILLLASMTWLAVERPDRASATNVSVAAATSPDDLSRQDPATALPALPVDTRSTAAIPPATGTLATTPATGSMRLTAFWDGGTPAAGITARIFRTGIDTSVDALDVTIGEDGTRLIEGLAPGRRDIFVDRSSLQEHCDVVAGECAEVELNLPRGVDVSGRVIERGGRTIAGADIRFDRGLRGWTSNRVAISDANGRFLIRAVGADFSWIFACAKLHPPSERRALVGLTPGSEEIELVLDPAGAALEGMVYGFDEQPLPGAKILVGPEDDTAPVNFADGRRGMAPSGQMVISDERGRFALAGVPIGANPVQVRANDHSPWSGAIETIDQHTAHLDVHLVRCTALTGRVTDLAGAPVAGAEVRGHGNFAFASRYSRTASDGTFAMSDLPAGEFQVSVQAKGLGTAEVKLNGAAGAQLVWNPVLGSGMSIRGRLVLAGTDFSTWYVQCSSQDRPPGDFKQPTFFSGIRPNSDGSFEIRGCADIAHELKINSPDASWFAVATRRDVRPGDVELLIPIDPSLLGSCRLRGRIVDENAQPVPGLQYYLGREGIGATIRSTGSDGTFDAESLPPGKYSIGVQAAGFAPHWGELVEVAAGTTWDFGDLQLERGGTISVHLKREPALAQAGLEIYARQPGSQVSAFLPVLGDVANSETLTPGEYILTLYGDDAFGPVARRGVRAVVRKGEATKVEMNVELGVQVTIALTPRELDHAAIQALDDSGAVIWEDAISASSSLALPVQTVRLVARDDAGHRAEMSFASAQALRGQTLTLKLE